MKVGFKRAGKIFKYLTVLFVIAYWAYIVIDDWVFIEKYWTEHWIEYIGIWTAWFLIYFLAFSFLYWITATIIVLIYFKLLLRNRMNDSLNWIIMKGRLKTLLVTWFCCNRCWRIYFQLIIFIQQQEESEAKVFQIHLLTATPLTLAAIEYQSSIAWRNTYHYFLFFNPVSVGATCSPSGNK